MRFDGVRWSRLSPASFVVPEPAVDAAEPAIRVVTPAGAPTERVVADDDLALSDARRALVPIRAGIARGYTPDESLNIASTVRPST